MTTPRCKVARLVEKHFTGRIDPADERELRAHLPECASCKELYERHQVLARLDPAAPSAQDRLARGLGFGPAPRRGWTMATALAGIAAATLLCVAVLGRDTSAADDGYVARGHGGAISASAELRVFRLNGEALGQTVAQVVHGGDELAFAYTNPEGRGHLMVYGVDDAGKVYWYVPAWTDPGANPRAVAIAGSSDFHEVGEAVTHALPGGHVTLHALFTDHAFTVRDIEALLVAAPDVVAQLGHPHLEIALEVQP